MALSIERIILRFKTRYCVRNKRPQFGGSHTDESVEYVVERFRKAAQVS